MGKKKKMKILSYDMMKILKLNIFVVHFECCFFNLEMIFKNRVRDFMKNFVDILLILFFRIGQNIDDIFKNRVPT